jgi:PleD family two-component response regulator
VLGEEFSLERLIESADRALYMSKDAGRDLVSSISNSKAG